MSLTPPSTAQIKPEPASARRALIWPILIQVTLFVVSGQSVVAVPPGLNFFSADKVAHFGVFGALATAWIRLPWFQRRGWRGGWMVFLLVSAFGGLDEWRQSFTPGRFIEFDDWLADSLGALTAVVLYQGWPAYRRLMETQFFRRRATNMPSP